MQSVLYNCGLIIVLLTKHLVLILICFAEDAACTDGCVADVSGSASECR